MSIDLNWETVTGGPDGQRMAEGIRDFIHNKFQSVPLPRFIKSVTVHDFQFGTIPPELELKDVTDPLPDFYEDHVDSDMASDDSDGESDGEDRIARAQDERRRRAAESEMLSGGGRNLGHLPSHLVFGSPGGPGQEACATGTREEVLRCGLQRPESRAGHPTSIISIPIWRAASRARRRPSPQ
ncbi:hypothetical protein VTH06DRAFT_689 [Thermothelomyces fergusii]